MHPFSHLGRLGLPRPKDFERDWRDFEAAREYLHKLSFPWHTSRQLGLLAHTPRVSGEPFSFAVVGDAEPGRFWFERMFNRRRVFRRLLERLEAEAVDFSMQLGDMVSRGVLRNYLRFMKELCRVRVARPYLTVIGNHDRRNPHKPSDGSLYHEVWGPTHYHFDHGGVRFIVLDTSQLRLAARQLKWLGLALRTDLRKVIFTHVPPAGLSPWTNFAGLSGVGGFKKGGPEFMELVSRSHVDRIYVGHIHGFGVLERDGVRYVLSGGGGSPLFPSGARQRFHHYLTVRFEGSQGFRETVHRLDGTTFSC